MKEILITNDDGYESEGLKKLVIMLKKEFKARVKVLAPATEKSGCSHCMSLTSPLKIIKEAEDFYKLDDGTPSDCVYLALNALYKEKLPDLVISGINHGANISEDILCSGTCAGAMEAVLQGIPALALSQFFKKQEQDKLDFTLALKLTQKLVENIFSKGFPLEKKEFLNVNFPSSLDEFKGLKIAKAGKRIYNHKAFSNVNPRGVEYYWLGASGLEFEEEQNSDISLLMQGYATITPIMLDLTAYNKLQSLEKWIG